MVFAVVLLAVAAVLLSACGETWSASGNSSSPWEESGIVPEVLASPPEAEMLVMFDTGAVVRLGNELKPSLLRDEPTMSWNTQRGSLHTVLMVAPDYPTTASDSAQQLLHILVVNVPRNNMVAGDYIWRYLEVIPAYKSGIHRYIFLVYKQAGVLDCDEACPLKSRSNFSVRSFSEALGLGNPIAGNFFLAQSEKNASSCSSLLFSILVSTLMALVAILNLSSTPSP